MPRIGLLETKRKKKSVGLRSSPTFRFPHLFCTGQNKEHENSLRREKKKKHETGRHCF